MLDIARDSLRQKERQPMDFLVGVLFTLWVLMLVALISPGGIHIDPRKDWAVLAVWLLIGGGVSALSL